MAVLLYRYHTTIYHNLKLCVTSFSGCISPSIGEAHIQALKLSNFLCNGLISFSFNWQETNENLEDASNELILTDEEAVRFQIGEVFAHGPKDEVESRIEQMKEVTTKNFEKLEEEKDSVLAQMAELKKILYAKFKDSINLEED